MYQLIKSIGIQLLFLVWVFSSMNAQANDPGKKEDFSWRLILKGDNPTTYTGTITSNSVIDRSRIVDSDGRDVSNVCCNCSPYDHRVFRAESRMTLQSGSPFPPPERTPFWLFSQPDRADTFLTTARHTLMGQIREGRPYPEESMPESFGRGISITDVSPAGRASSIENPPSSMPVATGFILLVESDHAIQPWLQQVINEEGPIESVVIIPGFLHTPTRVTTIYTSSNSLNQRHTVVLQSDHPEINRITVMVSPAEQQAFSYRIDEIQFEGANMSLTINRLPEVVRSPSQPRNAGDQQGALFFPETVEQGTPPLNGQNASLSGSFSEVAENHQDIVRMTTLPLPLNEK